MLARNSIDDGPKLLFASGASTSGAGIGSKGKAADSGTLEFFAGGGSNTVGSVSTTGAWTIGPASGTLTHTIQSNFTILRVQGLTSGSTVEVRSAGGSGSAISFQDSTATGDVGGIGHITGVSQLQARCGASGGVQLSNGATSWSALSDITKKRDVFNLSYGLSNVMKLRSVFYNYKDDASDYGRRLGFIAQEVQQVLPELVQSNSYEKLDGAPTLLSLDVTNMVPVLVKAIQELKTELDAVKGKLAELGGV